MKPATRLFLALVFALGAAAPRGFAAFDPVGEDVDIFLANPTYAATRPNVLVMLDNSANWNTPFTVEKNALKSVADTVLNDNFNVGLGMFVETGTGNDSVDGAYVRFGVRQMDATNRAALKSIVDGFHILNDKSNNSVFSLSMYEAFAYFAGITARAGAGKVKRDANGNAAGNPIVAPLAGNALSSLAATTYVSPIVDGCQKNFIIFISNGPANDNASSLQTAESLLGGLQGLPSGTAPATISISPSGSQNNWMDEYAQFMANNDCNGTFTGKQTVITYVIDIRGSALNPDLDHSALLESAATKGKGRYILISYDKNSSTSTAAVETKLKDALTSIFQEIQAVNSVFASVTLPVSVNVRGTNLNQVYIGVFRPDSARKPRWFGNLKLYNLQATSSGVLFLADATQPAGLAAENATTGFITNTAKSFWTTDLTDGAQFWSFRTPFDSTDIGQGKDLPDGDLVEKGGAAQRLRYVYRTSQAARNVYTCIGADCAANSDKALSLMPFSTGNTANITSALLGTFTTKTVDSITSAGTKATATVIGHGYSAGQTVIISGATPSVYNGTFTILGGGDAPTTDTFKYTMLSAPSGLTAQVNATAHGLVTGDTVSVDSTTDDAFDTGGTDASIVRVDDNIFTYTLSTLPTTVPSTVHTVTGKRQPTLLTSLGTTATVSLSGHGLATLNTVSIVGANESDFNRSNVAITKIDNNTFTYPLLIAPSAASNSAQVTTSTPHGFSNNDTVTIAGSTNSGYHGSKVITVTGSTTFTYGVAGLTADATGGTASKSGSTLSVTSMVHASGSGTVTVTTSTAHGLAVNEVVNISGSTYPQYNGSFSVSAVSGTDNKVFSIIPTTPPSVSAATTPATGAMSATRVSDSLLRSITSITHKTTGTAAQQAVATVTTTVNHGYSVNDLVTISGADQAAYNGTWIVNRVGSGGNANEFDFTNAGTAADWPTPAAGTITAGTASTVNIATLQRLVSATNSVSTGPIRVTRAITASSIATQTNASGVMKAANTSQTDDTERDKIINWVRGEENNEDEDTNEGTGATNNRTSGSATGTQFTVRSTIHGDVLHSRPAVVNYSRTSATNADDVYVFYGANDGAFHAVKAGFTKDAAITSNDPGDEAWSFVPSEFYGRLKRLRDNSPVLSTAARRDYFFDGPIAVYTLDVGGEGTLLDSAGDKVRIYISARRGGRFMYALDVSKPEDPKFLWKIGCPNGYNADGSANNTGCTTGFEEMGQTWSEPKIGWIRAHTNPVLIFGAGYDPAVEDIQPCLITDNSSTSVTARLGGSVTFTSTGDCSAVGYTSTTVNRVMGRGIYIVDAVNGSLVRYIGNGNIDASLSTKKTTVSGMKFAMPADVTVLNRDRDTGAHTGIASNSRESTGKGFLDRIYAVDTGGNVWRVDIDDATATNWVVTKLASMNSSATATGAGGFAKPISTLKFLFAPDVVFTSEGDNVKFDAVLLGSGDREHPFDGIIRNRFFMLKDFKTGLNATGQSTIGSEDLFDATSNCIQTTSTCTDAQRTQAKADLLAAKGWKMSMFTSCDDSVAVCTGEKIVSSASTIAGTTFYNTNQPSALATAGSCGSNLGIAREYAVSFKDATATLDLNASSSLTTADRSVTHAGGGFLPSPVAVVVQIGDKKYQAVISGTSVRNPGGLSLENRLRTYWYKKIE